MTTSLDLVTMVRDACDNTTAAGPRVYGPGDWPSQVGTLPQLKIKLQAEDREAVSRSGAPAFNTTATIRIIAEVESAAQPDDAGATAAETALWALKRQVEVAVINSYPLTKSCQQILSVRSQLAFNSDGGMHVATLQMDVSLLFYEGSWNFAPVASAPLETANLEATNFPLAEGNVGFTTSLPQE